MDPLAPYDYVLPPELIARHPPRERDGGRLLDLRGAGLGDRRIDELEDAVGPGDLVVLNDTRVLHARLFATRATGGRVEVLFLGDGAPQEVFLRPSRRLRPGEVLSVGGHGHIVLLARTDDGSWLVDPKPSATELMETAGEIPLPPYLGRSPEPQDAQRYQTVYAREPGAVAAPTAGLHLTEALLECWKGRGAEVARLTLHVGPGTFRPLRPEDLERGELHEEAYVVPLGLVQAVERTRARGGRVLAVGTTSCRALEACADPQGRLDPGPGRTRLFIQPGYRFKVVDRLLTNFHLPRSSLLALVQAFAGRERVREAYSHAVAQGYRFYSYGDAMLLDRAATEYPVAASTSEPT